MTEPFYLAAIPDTWEILGVKLRPFSLGHVILLHRIESPFVVGPRAATEPAKPFDDLALAVLLCSETYENGLRIINDPALPRVLRQWANRLAGMDRWLVRLRLQAPTLPEFAKEATEFCEYVREHSKIPNYDFNPADFRQIDCPEVQLVKVTLMREMHISEEAILDRCWGKCLWDYVTLRALDGKVKMIDAAAKEDALNVANAVMEKIKSGELKIPGIR